MESKQCMNVINVNRIIKKNGSDAQVVAARSAPHFKSKILTQTEIETQTQRRCERELTTLRRVLIAVVILAMICCIKGN